ncbi:hypothetical protein K8S17_02005 [bacterium]|nr:hypothetical protein [bacterium]
MWCGTVACIAVIVLVAGSPVLLAADARVPSAADVFGEPVARPSGEEDRVLADAACVELWRVDLVASDIRIVTAETVDLDDDGFDELLLAIQSRVSGPHVEVRDGATGELWWRRLPGGESGDQGFALGVSSSTPDSTRSGRGCVSGGVRDSVGEIVLAAGDVVVMTMGNDGRAIASARLPGTVRGAAAFGSCILCTVEGEELGFADRLVCLETARSTAASEGVVGAVAEHSDTSIGADAPVSADRSVVADSVLADVWSRSLSGSRGTFDDGFSRPVLGDVDGDGRHDLLFVERMNELVCLSDDGSERWRVVLGEKSRFAPVGVVSAGPLVAEVTGDGIPDVVVGCFAGAVPVIDGETGEELARMQFGVESHARHAKGRRLPRFLRETLARTGEPIGEILPVELDGVPGAELVFGCSDGVVYAVSPRKQTTLWTFTPERDVYDRPVAMPVSVAAAEAAACRPLVLWDERCVYVLGARDGVELTRLEAGLVTTAAVLRWHEAAVDIAVVNGASGSVRSVRLALPR